MTLKTLDERGYSPPARTDFEPINITTRTNSERYHNEGRIIKDTTAINGNQAIAFAAAAEDAAIIVKALNALEYMKGLK
jgi:hypothetical protein